MHTHFFNVKAIACVALIGLASVTRAVTLDELNLIQQGKQFEEQTELTISPSEITHSAQFKQAQREVSQFVSQLQASNPTMRNASEQSKQQRMSHGTLLFASYSLGEQGLKDLLETASGEENVVVVFRGVPEGMTVAMGIRAVQLAAAELDPVPNVIINPTLFRKYNVSSVPTIIIQDNEEQSLPTDAPTTKIKARVAGLSSLSWLREQLEIGISGDLGIRGPVSDILEPDLIDVAKARMAKIDWAEKKRNAITRFWKKQLFNTLPLAMRERERLIDPSIVVYRNITAHDGTVIVPKGQKINPLCAYGTQCKAGTRQFTQAVIVFNPLDERQVAAVKQQLPLIKQTPGLVNIRYLITGLERESGWDSYKSITDEIDAPVFLLKPEIISRFELEYVPSVITAKGDQFVVHELDANKITL